MDRQPKLTPRTKEGQVAPEFGAWREKTIPDPQPAAQTASVAPLPAEAEQPVPFADEVDAKVRLSGRAALKDNFRLYCKLMVPLTLVSLWMFALFAAISWVVPHILCEESVKELSVRAAAAVTPSALLPQNLTPYPPSFSPAGFFFGHSIVCV